MAKVVCIIQARRGSTRLPDKILKPLAGKTVLNHVIDRCMAIRNVDEVILATVDNPREDILETLGLEAGASVYRGSEQDVLDRYYQAAKEAHADYIMRVTSDCPLLDPTVCGDLIDKLLNEKADYGGVGNFPHGLDCEICTMALLEEAHTHATSKQDREHVTLWMKKRDDLKKVCYMPSDGENYSHLRWTLDYPEDYKLLEWIFENIASGEGVPNWRSVVERINDHPEVLKINAEQADSWAALNAEIYKNAETG